MLLPHSFSWRSAVSPFWSRTPRGAYAADAFDQHRGMTWCGACYLVAAVQMVEDRWNIERARRLAQRHPTCRDVHARHYRRQQISMQVIMDAFQEYAGEAEEAEWNVCLGGFSEDVLRCMTDATRCPLVADAEPGRTWYGRVLTRFRTGAVVPDVGAVVSNVRRVPHADVKAHLMSDGPLVLYINAPMLTRANAEGVVPVPEVVNEENHAVCVVGWETRPDGNEYYIIRNSWGTDHRAPAGPPEDTACVTRYVNKCTMTQTDVGYTIPRDPGFLFLPTWYPNLSASDPFFAADVVLTQDPPISTSDARAE